MPPQQRSVPPLPLTHVQKGMTGKKLKAAVTSFRYEAGHRIWQWVAAVVRGGGCLPGKASARCPTG